MTTTIEIYGEDLFKWRHWCRQLGVSSKELMRSICEQPGVEARKKLYGSLEKPVKVSKVLSGKRIPKSYRKSKFIQ